MRSDGTRRLLEGSLVMMKLVNPESIFKCDFALVNHYQISFSLPSTTGSLSNYYEAEQQREHTNYMQSFGR